MRYDQDVLLVKPCDMFEGLIFARMAVTKPKLFISTMALRYMRKFYAIIVLYLSRIIRLFFGNPTV